MRRRTFFPLLGGAAAIWPLRAVAQQPGTLKRIAYINPASANAATRSTYDAWLKALTALGWTEGRTITIDQHWAGGDAEKLRQMTAKAVADKADLLVTVGQAAFTARDATKTIPTVAINLEAEPVADGLVQSLARPGGNITGMFLNAPELGVKLLQLLKEIMPELARVGVLSQPVVSDRQLAAVMAASGGLGLTVTHLPFKALADIETSLAAMRAAKAQALLVLPSPLMNQSSAPIAAMAMKAAVPSVSMFRTFSEYGGLLHYGPVLTDIFRRSATLCDRILRGTRPADLAAEQPTKFEMALNLKTAKALGLTIPPLVLAQADEVIE